MTHWYFDASSVKISSDILDKYLNEPDKNCLTFCFQTHRLKQWGEEGGGGNITDQYRWDWSKWVLTHAGVSIDIKKIPLGI